MSTEKIKVDTSNTHQEKSVQKEQEKKKTKRKPLVEGVKKKKYKRKKPNSQKINYATHDGVSLTVKEAKFIDIYIETGNQRQSIIEAGYKTANPGGYAQMLLRKEHIKSEIDWRLKQLEDAKIASAEEILKFYTSVMRGEEKDQFGLEVPVGERIKAANELAKRKIDIVNKVQGGKDTAEVKITLNWEDMFDDEEESND